LCPRFGTVKRAPFVIRHWLFAIVTLPFPLLAFIPLAASPDWTSIDNDYSTGGAFADVDTNGFVDFCIANGNDMALDHNAVYLNTNGTLETGASWRSADSGYFGHCYAGDIDNDGLMDLAVAYLGSGGSGDLRVGIYRNTGSGLGTSPYWKAADQHSSFDCGLGDVDLDGDLDLAISAGDAYSGETDSARIYRNNGGVFDTLPCWTGHDGTASDAIRFCDIDNDGDLDLFVGQRRRISMYRNNHGTLETTPAWVARTGVGWVLRLAFGDYDNDGYLDLAAAANGQLGDPNSIKVFHNNNGTLDTIACFNMQRRGTSNYSSCVAWGDGNGDGYVDLAAGGWWRPAVVYENRSGVLDTLPTWTCGVNPNYLVCEALVWTDVDNSHITSHCDSARGNGERRLFNLNRRPLQTIDSVLINNVPVPRSQYCCDPLLGWVSFATPPPVGSTIQCWSSYATHPDLAVTNWDPGHGNYLFKNTSGQGVVEESGLAVRWPSGPVRVLPNPAAGPMHIELGGALPANSSQLHIYTSDGRLVRTLCGQRQPTGRTSWSWCWDGKDATGRTVAPGSYFARPAGSRTQLRLIRTSR